MKFTLLTSAAFALSAAAASAGGFTTAPEPVVVEPVAMPVASVGNWQGAYGGVTLGYATGGKDDFGFDDGVTEPVPTVGRLELSGVNGDLHVGYRWQRDRWVFGPELSIMGGKIDDSIDVGDFGSIESKVKHVAALKMKAGYEVQPNMLVYGTLGATRGKFEYKISDAGFSESYDYKANGYVFGLGVERMVTDRMSIVGEIERNNFKKKDVDLGPAFAGIETHASPNFTNVKLGVNFKF